MKRIDIVNFDPIQLKIEYTYLGEGPEVILMELKWKGASFYFHRHQVVNGVFYYSISFEKEKDLFDEIQATFKGVGWEETYTLPIDYRRTEWFADLPRIESPEEDYCFGTYVDVFVKRTYGNDFIDVKEGDVCVDIGANIGTFAMYASRKKAKKIFCYEPAKVAYKYLKLNTADIDNVKRFNFAVDGKEGIGVLNESISSLGTAGSFLSDCSLFTEQKEVELNQSNPNDYEKYEVRTITLEKIIEENSLDHIDYLKIDCEGPELGILQSIPTETFEKISKICVESHDAESTEKIKEILTENKFALLVQPNYGCQIIYGQRRSINIVETKSSFGI